MLTDRERQLVQHVLQYFTVTVSKLGHVGGVHHIAD
jgi:hypothetical protein